VESKLLLISSFQALYFAVQSHLEASMELREALTQIAEIRRGVTRAEVFRGYRAVPVAFSGLLALAAAILQHVVVGNPTQNLPGYLTFWMGVALVSVCATGLEMLWSLHVSPSSLERQKTLVAVREFLPCLVVGGLVTMVVARWGPGGGWMLPGLWAMLFGLGIFASQRFLPRAIIAVAVY
jgi:hypothetical protein